jgi:phosphoglucosamine mutase
MARKLFGTDGIRGEYGEYPLDAETVRTIGYSSGKILGGDGSKVLIGCDTRESCDAVKESLIRGFSLAGVASYDAGVFPTPAVAAMVEEKGFDFGAVISASHNPYRDNGIKFFSGKGAKFPDSLEEEIEDLIGRSKSLPAGPSRLKRFQVSFDDDYLDFLLSQFPDLDLGGKKVLLDCANGAVFNVAPRLFKRLGADVIAIADKPDGKNINEKCGSLHAAEAGKMVREAGAEFGFSFDGDGDRCLGLNQSGIVLDGDNLLYAEAKRRKAKGILKGNLVVGTVMSNYGLEQALDAGGMDFLRAQVGDRYVLEALREKGGELGGEPSGHIIFLDMAQTGDGLLTSLVYSRIAMEGGGMEALAEGITRYSQKIINLRVKEKRPLEEIKELNGFLAEAEKIIEGKGRIVLRYSGTEPLLRIMIEAKSEEAVERSINILASGLESVLT